MFEDIGIFVEDSLESKQYIINYNGCVIWVWPTCICGLMSSIVGWDANRQCIAIGSDSTLPPASMPPAIKISNKASEYCLCKIHFVNLINHKPRCLKLKCNI